MESICTDNTALERLVKHILVLLIAEYESDYAGKEQGDRQFFATHEDLFNKAKKMRGARFKRKRVLVLTDTPLKRNDWSLAVNKLQSDNPLRDLQLKPGQIDIKYGNAVKSVDSSSLLGTCDYSDIIIFVTGTKDENAYLHQLIAILREKPLLYPHLTQRFGQRPTAPNLTASLRKTLWFAHKTNDDERAWLWQKYAFYDHLADLIKNQVSTANRTNALTDLYRRYGLPFIKEDVKPQTGTVRILVLGESRVPVVDLQKIIAEAGLDPQIFEFRLKYFDAAFSFESLRKDSKFTEVLIGPLPHSVKGKGDYSSGLVRMEQNPDVYLHVTRVTVKNQLKITQNSFRHALRKTNLYAERNKGR